MRLGEIGGPELALKSSPPLKVYHPKAGVGIEELRKSHHEEKVVPLFIMTQIPLWCQKGKQMF